MGAQPNVMACLTMTCGVYLAAGQFVRAMKLIDSVSNDSPAEMLPEKASAV